MPVQSARLDSIAEIHAFLFDIMDDGVLVVDCQGNIIDCNPAFHQRLGYDKAALIGTAVARLDPPEFAPRVPDRIRDITQNGQAVFETAHYRKDGSIMPVELNARLVKIGDKNYIFSIVRDISERKAMDRALRDREQMYRALVETSADGFWAADAQGRIIEVNDAYITRSGYSREELLNMRIGDLEAVETPEETAAHVAKIMRDGHDRFETWHKTKSGEIWPVEIVTTFWPFNGGIFLVFNVDISERKRAEEELNKLSQAIRQAGEGIMITDPRGIIEYINPAFSGITGYTPEEAIGQHSSILKSNAQDPALYQQLWRTITSGEIWEGTLIDKRKDGTFYPALMSIAPIFDGAGEITHYVAIQKDMTELKRMEHQLVQTQKMEAIGTLVGGIAHDFNNMLAALQGNVFLAQSELDDKAAVAEYLQTIDQLSEKAALVVKQLLTFAKKDRVEMEPVTLNKLLTEGFKLAKSTIPENIDHQLNCCDETLVVNADITQLQQAMINLSNNARDALIRTECPRIEWSLQHYEASRAFLTRHPKAQHRHFAHITVRDNGHGIDEIHMQTIFDPFFTTKGPDKGTGLGLAMVHGSIERHDGFLEVESRRGSGTAFHIYLPLIASPGEQVPHASHAPVHGHGETILLVDDEDGLRQVTAQVLGRMGYRIIEACDGAEALTIFRSRQPIDLILTDVVMPRMGGVELAREVHRDNSAMPIIFATGYDRDELMRNSLQIETRSLLSKPFSYDSLSRLIRKMLAGE